MAERPPWKVGKQFSAPMWVFDSSNNPVTGLSGGSFVAYLCASDAVSAQPVTITETSAGSAPGRYSVAFTPNAAGPWDVRVKHATYNPRGWAAGLDAYAHDLADVSTLVDALVPVLSATVVDGSPTASGFGTSLTQADGYWEVAILVFLSGTLVGQARAVTTYLNASGAVTFNNPFTTAPSNGDSFAIAMAASAGNLSNLDAPVSSRAATGDAMTLAAGAVDAAQITADAANKLADHAWRRSYASVRGSSDGDAVVWRSPLGAVGYLVNKRKFLAGQLLVYHEDDSTLFEALDAVTNANGSPVIELDPT